MSKRVNGTGSVFQAANGRWEMSVSYYRDGTRRRLRRRFLTRAEAESALAAIDKPTSLPTAAERFAQKVTKGEGCWIYSGQLDRLGYGLFSVGPRKVLAHRFSYETIVGPIPAGHELLHSCDVPACVRPDHLTPGTHTDNMRDSSAKGRSRNQFMPRVGIDRDAADALGRALA